MSGTPHTGQGSARARRLEARTAAHYDRHPLEFLSSADQQRLEDVQPAPFRAFVHRYLEPGDAVADIGCGPGRAAAWLCERGMNVTALDLSVQSLQLARARAPGAGFVQASNLRLPFADGTFQAVVSDGVIHHTPDARAAFRETCRVLREGGVLYLGVYRRRGYYHYVYRWVGSPVRWLHRWGWGRWLVHATLLPAYYVVHLAKSRGHRSWAGARNFFHDYLVTPVASFHTPDEVGDWAREAGMERVGGVVNFGNTHVFLFRRGHG